MAVPPPPGKEKPLIIRIKVVHSDAFQRLILLTCTAFNLCPDKNSNNKTNKKTIGLLILPDLCPVYFSFCTFHDIFATFLSDRDGQG